MANFEDITGWWEELDTYRRSEEWKQVNQSQKMPIEWVPELMHLVLRHAEIREVFMTYGNCIIENHKFDENDQPIPFDELPDDFPYKESDIAAWFAIWFFNIGKKVNKILPIGGEPPATAVARLVAKDRQDIMLRDLVSELERNRDDNFFDLTGLEHAKN